MIPYLVSIRISLLSSKSPLKNVRQLSVTDSTVPGVFSAGPPFGLATPGFCGRTVCVYDRG